ncbi:MAG: FecR domain-containing protein [Candidatus Brocadiia bacterium]
MRPSEERDRLIDMLLRQLLGGEEPPDLTARILARAFPWRRRAVIAIAAAAALALAAGAWLLLASRYPQPEAKGSYTVADGGPVRRGATLLSGEEGASLSLGGYCRVELQPGSALRIEGQRHAEQVFLEKGGAACQVDRQAGQFAVRTPVGTVEVTGTEFTVRIVESEGGAEMLSKRLIVHVLTGTVLVTGAWGELALGEGERRKLPEERRAGAPEPEAQEARQAKAVLPAEAAGFRGYLIGNILEVDSKGCLLEVASARPLDASKAPNPDVLVGKKLRTVYIAFRGPDGRYHSSQWLHRVAHQLYKKGGLCTVKAFAERDEALIITAAWDGARLNPEAPDEQVERPRDEETREGERPRGEQAEREREGEREGERDREGEGYRPAEERDDEDEGERGWEGDRDDDEGEEGGERRREGDRDREGEGERGRDGDRERDREGEGDRPRERDRDDHEGEGERRWEADRDDDEGEEGGERRREGDRDREGEGEGRREGDRDRDREGEGDRDRDREGEGDRDRDREGEGDRARERDRDREGEGDGPRERERDREGEGEGRREERRDADF